MPTTPIEPRLRVLSVLLRGLGYGAVMFAAIVLIGIAVSGHEARLTYYAVSGGFAMIAGAICLVFGPFYWLCAGGDVRRWRDWRSLQGRYGAVAVLAPAFVRLIPVCAVVALGSLCAYAVVDAADPGSIFFE